MSIELESEGLFCPQRGSKMKQFGPKQNKQYRCLEEILNIMQLIIKLKQ